jgi:PHD/YefM family antitoxin component YafN of YafNO toxin-antitoxin module
MEDVATEAVATEAVVAEPTALAGEATAVETSETPSMSNEEIFAKFKESAGDDLKGHSYLDKYKTAEDFIKAGINHQSSLTKKASEYFESEDPVVIAERNKLMGVPDSADDYEVSAELAEAVSEESLAAFKAKAHEMGLPAKYVEEMVQFEADLWTQHAQNQEAERVAETEAVTAALKEVWKGDTFDHNTKQVQNLLINELGLSAEDLSQPIGNSSKLITALFDKVVPMYGDDKLIEGTMTQTRASASERMTQLNQEMHATAHGTPAYKALLEEKVALMGRMKV